MTLNVAFLWHMHQPLYIDPENQEFLMPWVRMHGVKAYSDMLSALEGSEENVRVTFNLVPSLLYQIEQYSEKKDRFFELSRRPPQDLNFQERVFILRHFFSCHWPTMVEPYERYRQLLDCRGREINKLNLEEISRRFSDDDIRDLQVWFNLTWVGFSHRKDPFIQGLLKKGRLFTEDEKKGLLDFHLSVLEGLISRYRELWKSGKIDISTTPFYHPILPLLIDSDSARRAMPDAMLPSCFSYPEDALAQLSKSVEYMKRLFGKSPTGLWPSEGSVCPELIPLVRDAGFKWMATDEGILKKSIGHGAEPNPFEPYYAEYKDYSIPLVFRHHELSDLIGFVYHKTDTEIAIRDFHSRLKEILGHFKRHSCPPLCAIILDGENPWEYYQDGGQYLLRGIYNEISKDPEIQFVTITDYLEEYPPTKTIKQLHTGSWINSDFSIWIGGKEENTAWEELLSARSALSNVEGTHAKDPSILAEAREWIYAAEGSDWFWWYGDKFHSDFALLFDSLFRSYLKRVYETIGQPWPSSLDTPIKREKAVNLVKEPMGFIDPEIDGRLSFYWEWSGAGSLEASSLTSMYKTVYYIKEVLYGFNLNSLFLKVSPYENPDHWLRESLKIVVNIRGERVVEFALEFSLIKGDPHQRYEIFVDGQKKNCEDVGVRYGFYDILELGLPFALLGRVEGEELDFFVEVFRDGVAVERWPEVGTVGVRVPDKDFESRLWLI